MKMKMLFAVSLSISTGVYAGGFRVALQGQNALGMGHAGVAVTDSAEVVFFNPASMSLLKSESNLNVGTTLIKSETKYQNTLSNTSASTDNAIGTPFYVYQTKRVNEAVSIGFGIYTPFGNAVKWPTDWQGSHIINNISLKTIYYQPTVSYKVNNQLSLGVGPTLVNGYVEYNRNINFGGLTLKDSNGDRSSVTINGNGIVAWGFNAGLLYKPIPSLSVGVNYRSQVDLKANDRSVKFDNIPDSLKTTFSDTTFSTKLALPAELTFGVAYHLSANTLVAVDINRTFWSAYKSLDISFNNGLPTSLGPQNYQDANVYRIGLQQKIKSKFILRAGAYFDDTPILDGYQSPVSPRNNSIGLTAGASYAISKNLAVDASFLYLMFDEFTASYDFVGHDTNPATQDGSFGGDYVTSVTTYGLGLNYKY